MSSNQLISVPRELIQEMLDAMLQIHSLPQRFYGSTLGDRVRAILAQPAEQNQDKPYGWTHDDGKEFTTHADYASDLEKEGIAMTPLYTRPAPVANQVEPVALPGRMPTGNITDPHHPWAPGVREGWNNCLDEITKLGPLYTRPVQGEPVAWDVAARIADIPGVHEALKLFSEDPTGDAGTSLVREVLEATHAESGEVERLRAEIRSLRQHKTDYMEAAEETRKVLLAQLAEAREDRNKLGDRYDAAEAKLAELRSALEGMVEYFPEGHSDGECFSVEKAKAALSASAEPTQGGAQ